MLEQAVNKIVQRHEVLRTTYGIEAGMPKPLVAPEVHVSLHLTGIEGSGPGEAEAALKDALQEETQRPFDLTAGPPIRCSLWRLGTDDHVFAAVIHPLAADEWSGTVFFRELGALYRSFSAGLAPSLPALPLQYGDYAVWQRDTLKQEALDRHAAFWRSHMAGASGPVPLPMDGSRRNRLVRSSGAVSTSLSSDLSAKLADFCRTRGMTLFSVMLSVMNILLFRWTGEGDLVTGAAIDSRDGADLEPLIGRFTKFLPFRMRLSAEQPAEEFLLTASRSVIESLAHAEIPFDVPADGIGDTRNANPVFNVGLLVQNTPDIAFGDGGVRAELHPLEQDTAPFDLRFGVGEKPYGLDLECQYNADQFDCETIERVLESYRLVLELLITEPSRRLAEFELPEGLTLRARARAAAEETIAIAATFTAEPLEEPLLFWMDRLGIRARAHFAPYGQVFQELLDPASRLRSNKLGFDVILLRLEDWLNPEAAFDIQISGIETNVRDFCAALWQAARAAAVPYVVCITPPGPEAKDGELGDALRRMEYLIEAEVGSAPGVHLIKSEQLLDYYPVADYADRYGETTARIPYSRQMFTAIASMLARRVNGIRTAPSKVLVLDCDNTLWRGVCAEDGPLGVVVDESHLALQDAAIRWQQSGIILCLCSKNTEEDVGAVFEKNTDMRLRPEQIVASRLNWQPKSENLKSLARELSLGLDSFIFLDDNPLECAEVRANCPGAIAIELPSDERRIPHLVKHLWALDRWKTTREDERRTSLYRENLGREALRRSSSTLEDFLRDLELEIRIEPMRTEDLPRVSQLTQRTNQFNLTTVRRSESDLVHLIESGGQCLVIDVRDRFGDYGQTGVLLFSEKTRSLEIDTFLLSCRVLGRRVEHAVIAHLGDLALVRGLDWVDAPLVPTSRNAPARDFLNSVLQDCRTEESGRTVYRFDSAYAAGLRDWASNAVADAAGTEDEPAREDRQSNPAVGPIAEIAASFTDVEAIQYAIDSTTFARRGETRGEDAPRTAVEEIVAGMWARLLHIPQPGIRSDFFSLGGNSLLGAQVVARIRQTLGVEVPLREIFESPTVAQLASRIEAGRTRGKTSLPPPSPALRPDRIPLSFAQKRLWFIDQMAPGEPLYNIPQAFRVRGDLNVPALEQSIGEVVRRHESLRTTFHSIDGQPFQQIADELSVPLPVVAIRGTNSAEREEQAWALAIEEARSPFDLAKSPLFRAKLLRFSVNDHLLLLTMHHIIGDRWSMGVLAEELSRIYEAFRNGWPSPLSPLQVQYPDFALWQQTCVDDAALQNAVAYWRKRLTGAPALIELPTDRPRPAVQRHRGSIVTHTLGRDLIDRLTGLSQAEGATLFMILLAGFQAVLARYSGQQDVVVGSPIAGRNYAEVESLIGFFVSTVALRGDLSGDPAFRSLLNRVREFTLDAYARQDVPFERTVEELAPDRSLSHNPVFQVVFALQNAPMEPLRLSGLQVDRISFDWGISLFDISCFAVHVPDGILLRAEYDSDLFDRQSITRLLQHYENLLHAAVRDPGLRLSELPLLSDAEERNLITEWNGTQVSWPLDGCVHELFERRVAVDPKGLAVRAADLTLSYGELNERANQVAHRLRALGVGPEGLVAVALDRSANMLVAVLGALKAGAAYLPIDTSYPASRIAFMLEDAGVSVVLASERFQTPLPASIGTCLRLDTDWTDIDREATTNPPRWSTPTNLAYVIYTSGSTGRPKGVEVEHRSLINLVRWHQQAYDVAPNDRATLVASPAFDASVWEIWPYLASGASLHVPDEDIRSSPEDLLRWLANERITLSFLPTPLAERVLDVFYRERTPPELKLRALLTGGDKLHHAPPRDPGFLVVNHYGPTEGTVVTTWTPVPPGSHEPPPIGRPIANNQVYVLEPNMKPAPQGVPGELFVGGDSLARGYRCRPDLTAQRFLRWRGAGMNHDERLYRTGDRVRRLPGGDLEFLGRLDHQVKVRGFRIELGEIEAALAEHPRVRECVVDYREDGEGAGSIVAYLVPNFNDRGTESGEQEESSAEQVALWAATFDDAYKDSGLADATFNITGWNSSYTGEPIPPEEMRVWVETTVDRIVSLRPRSVWEIGCGTGLLLYRVAPVVEEYFATDFSQTAIDLAQHQIAPPERNLSHVRLQRAAAHEPVSGASKFDTVVLNSVIQYFPSLQYLFDVIRLACDSIRPEGAIFIGDVRSFPLLDLFHTSVQLHQATDGTRKREFFERVRTNSNNESELLVDPEFFATIGQRIPGIGGVEIQLKRGSAHNELTGFRYDVVLRVGKPVAQADCAWLDWEKENLNPELLHAMLEKESPDLLGLTRVPNARLQRDAAALRLLSSPDAPETIGELRQLLAAQPLRSGIEPEDLWQIESLIPYRFEIRPSSNPEDGYCDVVARRVGSVALDLAPLSFPAGGPRNAQTAWANNPLRHSPADRLAGELASWLEDRLPVYMVPSAFVTLESLPLLPSGKLDRRALPAPQIRRAEGGSPRTFLEEQIAAIWSAVLRVDDIGINDDFFALGGHSLLATQVTSRIRELTGADLPVRSLFETPTVAGLGKRIEAIAAGRATDLQPIPRVPRDQPLQLSFAQQRLWFLDQLEPDSALYSAPWALRLKGEARLDALEWALNRIVERHEIFRTVFGTEDHRPVQTIDSAFRLELPLLDLSKTADPETEMRRAALEEIRRPFNLETGPVFRASVLRVDVSDHVLLLNSHHIANDGWSLWQFAKELGDLYRAFLAGKPSPLSDLPVQYADFAAWQREWMQGEVLERQVSWWRRKLEGAPDTINFPADRPRPAKLSGRGATERLQLRPETAARLNELSRAEGATLFMTLLAAYQTLLFRFTAQEDVVVGAPIANRNRADIENIIGFFVNTIVMRTDLSGAPTFREVLHRVREYAFEAYTHQDVPFEKLVEVLRPERYLDRVPVFQVWFALQNVPRTVFEFPGLELHPEPFHTGTSKFDMGLFITETPKGLSCMVEYSTDLFEPATIRRFLGNFSVLIESIVEDPDRKIGDLSILTAAEERRQLAEWNATAPPDPVTRCIHEIFEEWAERSPGNVAVTFEGEDLTYSDLNRRANQLSHRLRALGAGPESLIGICLDRSFDALVAILAVLKSGAAYLPLDPAYPPERRAFMLDDARVPILLTESKLRLEHPPGAVTILLDEQWPLIAEERESNPEALAKPANAAYVIYTSGSTGRPKGAVITHDNVVRLFTATDHWFGFGPGDTWTLFHSFAFDFSVWEIWGALLHGGRLVIVPWIASRSPEVFHELLVEQRVTVLSQTPSAFRNLIAADERSARSCELALRYVIFGGEALEFPTLLPWITRHGDRPALINMYGITETTVHVTYFPISVGDVARESPSLIGVPIPDLQAYILDDRLRLLPEGATGQLYIGGAGLAREYLNRPELTAERFIPNPFDPSGASRLYKTGDLARYRPGGNLQYLGRCDQQVKIRGFRIELGEIEALLDSHPGVVRSVVVARDEGIGDTRLVGYIVPNKESTGPEIPQDGKNLASEQVSEWALAFNDAYQKTDGVMEATLNLTGWNSSYSRNPIPVDEMRVWVESTVDRINALRPDRMWELGCGTGLLLFRTAPRTRKYYGTDISTTALDFLRKQLERPELRLPQVTLERRAGHEIADLADRFDAVVINSVAQYFPDLDYLAGVIEKTVSSVDDGGAVFLGDLRNFALLELFHLSVQTYQAADSVTAPELRRRTEQAIFQESELLIDPALFGILRRRIPRIGRIEIQLKRGRAYNELTRFRYDAILHIGLSSRLAECAWLDWNQQQLTCAALREILSETRPDLLGVRGIPDARLWYDVATARLLAAASGAATAGELRSALRNEAGPSPIEPEDIWQMESDLPYRIEVRSSAIASDGLFDVLFRRLSSEGRVAVDDPVRFPGEDAVPKTLSGCASNPLRQRIAAQLVPKLRLWLGGKLPEYMVPSAIVVLDAIPLSANGKVDKRARPVPGDPVRVVQSDDDDAPRNPIEGSLAAIFADVLHVGHVGISDNFFDLGGHSLSATQVVSRARQLFQIEVPLRVLFERPTVAALAEAIDHLQRSREGLLAPPIERAVRGTYPPLSFAQQRLWVLDRLAPNQAHYNLPRAIRLRGALDFVALEKALNALVERHEVLRTNYLTGHEGPFQSITARQRVELPLIDLSALPAHDREDEARRIVAAEAGKPFNLTSDAMFRALLVRLEAREHILLLNTHHISDDGWSTAVIWRDLTALYAAASCGESHTLPQLAIQYADYAIWQREWLRGEVLDSQVRWWKSRLDGAPPVLSLPFDRPRPAKPTFRGAIRRQELPRSLADGICLLSRAQGVTEFMVLLAAFKTLLFFFSRKTDIILGTDVAGRNHVHTEDLVGFFVNLLVLRTDLSGDPSFFDLLRRVREVTLGAYAHQDVPFDKLVEEISPERGTGHNPLVQALFVQMNGAGQIPRFNDLDASQFPLPSPSKFDMAVFVSLMPAGIRCVWSWNPDLFDEETLIKMTDLYETLLESVLADQTANLSGHLEKLEATAAQRRAEEHQEFRETSLLKLKSARRRANVPEQTA